MTINEINYEEYFLLYADNELSVAEREAVEVFVKENPHLQKEFDGILATIQQPDQTIFTDKTFLFKSVNQFIHEMNYEKKLIEYLDNELNEADKKRTEEFMTGHEYSQTTFDWLRKSKLVADLQITYPYKNELYRKSTRVVFMRLISVGIAAALTGMMIWFGYNQLSVQPDYQEQQIAAASQNSDSQRQHVTEKPEQERNLTASSIDIIQPGPAAEVKEITRTRTLIQQQRDTETKGHEDQRIDAHPPMIARAEKPTPVDEIPQIDMAVNIPASEINKTIAETPDIQPAMVKNQQTQAGETFTYFEDEDPPSEYVFYDIPAEKLRNSKVGIFIKKVRRTIDRGNPINRFFNGDDIE